MSDDVWHRYRPTAQLRFVEREGAKAFDINTSRFGGPVEMRTYRILQQMWQHEETGREAWRDVPVSREEHGTSQ